MIGINVGLNIGSRLGALFSSGVADFIVANDTEWDAAIAAAVAGDVIEVSGSNFTRATVTGDFTGGGLTIRGADASAELPLGIRLSGTVSSVTFKDIKISRPQEAEGAFWAPLAVTVYGMILYTDTPVISDLNFDSVIFDGGLVRHVDGGRLTTNTSISLDEVDGFSIRRCTMQNGFIGVIFQGSKNGVAEDNLVTGMFGDAFVFANLRGDCEDIVVRNNHHTEFAGDNAFHMDFAQIQPANNSFWVRRIDISGNTHTVGTAPYIAQADRSITVTQNVFTADFAVPVTEHGMETRISPAGGGSVAVTMPSAAGALRQYSFRQTTAGAVSFVLDGADTWVGGTPSMSDSGDWVTFVSNGTSEWQKLTQGFRSFFLLATASRTLSDIEDGFVLIVDATAGNVTLTLPAGGTPTNEYTIRRLDNSANTVTLAHAGGGDSLTIHGGSVASIEFVQGYSLDISGTAGAWTATEDKPTSQVIFANAHPQGLFEDITVHGNVSFNTAGRFYVLEQDVEGVRVYNNTAAQLLIDDQNADGVVGGFEGNGGITQNIDVRSADGLAFGNFTVGGVILDNGDEIASALNNIELNASTNVGLESTYATYFNGAARADYQPVSRSDVLAAALAKPAGPLDADFVGALGTTLSNGYYDFVAGAVNAGALVAPAISSTTPIDGGTIGQDAPISVTFDQFVSAGTGAVVLYNETTSSVVETFNVATGTGDAGGTVAVSGRVLTVTPFASMTEDDHSLRIAATAIVGHYGVAFAGLLDGTGYSWTVINVPSAYNTVTANGGYLTRASAPTGYSTSATKLLFGANIFRDAASDQFGTIYSIDASKDIIVQITSGGEVRVGYAQTSFRIPLGAPASGPPETILLSVDATAATIADGVLFYRNGSLIDTSTFTLVNWVQNTTPGNGLATGILENTDNTGRVIHGEVGFVYADLPATLVDLSDPVVRAKFGPGQIGADGSGVTGTAPMEFITGPATAWNAGTNQGTGGNFTTTGTFTDV